LTVLFLWDRSLSMPQDFEDGKDLREDRLRRFINESVSMRGPGHERDQAGVIVFGRWPRLELPPGTVRDLRFRKIISTIDDTHTDIAAAIKLALASFPEGSAKRIVLISDGNQNLGSAEEQARLARSLGVQIDVLPLGAVERDDAGELKKRSNKDEVLVERVDVPPVVEQGTQVPIRVLVRSYNPNVVWGRLTVRQITEGDVKPVGKP